MDKQIKQLGELVFDFYSPINHDEYYYMNKLGKREKDPEKRTSKNGNVVTALQNNHVTGKRAVAVCFPLDRGRIIAFDIDRDLRGLPKEIRDIELQKLKDATSEFIDIIQSLDLKVFAYHSGGKGYHIEIRTEEILDIKILQHVYSVIYQLAVERGIGEYIDYQIRPGMKNCYKLFGTNHHETGIFTYAVDNRINEMSKVESWYAFAEHLAEMSAKSKQVNLICRTCKVENKSQKHISHGNNECEAQNVSGECVKYLKDVYANGLKKPDSRHNMAFSLGRLFKFVFKFDEITAIKCANEWLKNHYIELAGGNYFGDDARKCLSHKYLDCREKTIEQVRNAYAYGWAFKSYELIQFHEDEIEKYIEGVADRECNRIAKYKGYIKTVQYLRYVVGLAKKFQNFEFQHGREQFKVGFNTTNNTTVKNILKVLSDLEILVLLKEGRPGPIGTRGQGKTSKYKLILPENCYTIVGSNIEIPTDEEISRYG